MSCSSILSVWTRFRSPNVALAAVEARWPSYSYPRRSRATRSSSAPTSSGQTFLDLGRQGRARRVELNLDLFVEESMIRIRAFPAQCVSQGTVKGDALAEAVLLIHPRNPGHVVFRRAAVVAARRRPRQSISRDEELGTADRALLQPGPGFNRRDPNERLVVVVVVHVVRSFRRHTTCRPSTSLDRSEPCAPRPMRAATSGGGRRRRTSGYPPAARRAVTGGCWRRRRCRGGRWSRPRRSGWARGAATGGRRGGRRRSRRRSSRRGRRGRGRRGRLVLSRPLRRRRVRVPHIKCRKHRSRLSQRQAPPRRRVLRAKAARTDVAERHPVVSTETVVPEDVHHHARRLVHVHVVLVQLRLVPAPLRASIVARVPGRPQQRSLRWQRHRRGPTGSRPHFPGMIHLLHDCAERRSALEADHNSVCRDDRRASRHSRSVQQGAACSK